MLDASTDAAGIAVARSDWRPLPGEGPEEHVFVLGDIHGRSDLLYAMLGTVAQAPRGRAPTHLVFLGDLIDRGPDSLGCIMAALDARARARVDRRTLLPGNHELFLRAAIRAPSELMASYLSRAHGGMPLLAQVDPAGRAQDWRSAAQVLEEGLPKAFLRLIEEGPTHLRLGDALLVHAGICPDTPLERFLATDRFALWAGTGGAHWAMIREPFLSHRGGWAGAGHPDLTVFHGHTALTRAWTDGHALAQGALRIETHGRVGLDFGAAGLAQGGLAEIRDGQVRVAAIQVGVLPWHAK